MKAIIALTNIFMMVLCLLLFSFVDPICPSCNDRNACKQAKGQSAHDVKGSNCRIDLMFLHKAVVSIANG
jgi:hypothetical protein